tara:strand:- start:227 stop:1105 length:879 start_codon:yes stop_codon:yes gene_type:complete
MSILSKFVRDVSPAVATVASFIPNPAAQAVAFGAGRIAQDTARRDFKRAQEEQRNNMINYDFGGPTTSTLQRNLAATTPTISTQSSGGGFLDTLRSGIREVGGLVSDVFSTGIPQILGMPRTPTVVQQPAITTTSRVGAQESQGSGSIEAGFGSALPSILQGARNLLKSPGGQLAIGTGTGIAFSGIGSTPTSMRITRKMKSQARMVLNMTGGNLSAAADILGVDQNTLVMILLKRFRNDGPVVTKAALRKTKQTIRRLHSMQDVLKSITPTATMRRRAPMRRASTTTLIKN